MTNITLKTSKKVKCLHLLLSKELNYCCMTMITKKVYYIQNYKTEDLYSDFINISEQIPNVRLDINVYNNQGIESIYAFKEGKIIEALDIKNMIKETEKEMEEELNEQC